MLEEREEAVENLRRYSRAPIQQASDATFGFDKYAIELRDISVGGLGFTTQTPIEGVTEGLVYFRVLGMLFYGEVELVHSRDEGSRTFYGCVFTELSKKATDAIRRYVLAQGMGYVK